MKPSCNLDEAFDDQPLDINGGYEVTLRPLFGDYFMLTSRLLGFLGSVWGNKLMKNAVWGEISSGVGFLARGRGGRKAKVSLSLQRDCKKHDVP